MHKRRWPFWASAVVIAALVAAALVWTRLAAKAESDATAQRLQRIEQVQQDQSRQLEALLQQRPMRRSAAAQLPSARGAADRSMPRDAAPEAIARQLDAQHRAERVDRAWSAQAENELTRLARGDWVAEAGGGPTEFAVDCRSTSCRVDAQFVRQSQAYDWGELFLTQAGGTIYRSQIVVIPRAEGGAQLQVYSTRKPDG
ncbi:MAG: hypothetical protein H7Y19_05055 [Luteimonas sp.]|nr:hypothetical protein [Luteimonas sp.]